MVAPEGRRLGGVSRRLGSRMRKCAYQPLVGSEGAMRIVGPANTGWQELSSWRCFGGRES